MTSLSASERAFARLPSIFITGGNGYVGRNLIRHFVAHDVAVVALVRSRSAAETVRDLGAQPHIGDLFVHDLPDAMQRCAALIHAAADTNHGPATEAQRRTNIDGTHAIFAAARQAGIRRAVHLSTESLLLDGKPLVQATEAHPLPRRFPGSYSRTKAQAEAMALKQSDDAMEVIAVRPRFIWGRDDSTALPVLTAAARSGQLAWINGGHYLTSTTHIANACEGIDRALHLGRGGESYFITDAEPIAFRTFVTRLLETQGLSAPAKTVSLGLLRAIATGGEMFSAVSRGKIRPPVTRQDLATMAVEVTLDGSKAARELGYRPVLSRDEGLAELASGRWPV